MKPEIEELRNKSLRFEEIKRSRKCTKLEA